MVGLPGGPGSGLLGNAIRRGLIGRSRPWQVVLVVVALGRVLRLVSRPRPVVLRERLGVGETLEVRHLAPVDPSAVNPASRDA